MNVGNNVRSNAMYLTTYSVISLQRVLEISEPLYYFQTILSQIYYE
jgi:hypothetical protein